MARTTCPHCNIVILPMEDGTCPSCRRNISESSVDEPLKIDSEKSQHTISKPNLAWAIIRIAFGLWVLIGMPIIIGFEATPFAAGAGGWLLFGGGSALYKILKSTQHSKMTDPIARLTSGMFRQIQCPKMDALTVFVPADQEPSPEVKKYQAAVISCKEYPQDGGCLIMLPNIFKSYDEKIFKIEKNAWSRELCDKCNGTIEEDNTCWEAGTDEEYYLFCDSCYQKLKP